MDEQIIFRWKVGLSYKEHKQDVGVGVLTIGGFVWLKYWAGSAVSVAEGE